MFQFSPLASAHLWIQWGMTAYYRCRVSPFGHLRISAYVRLPEAFRSLSRPSSPVRAKASTVRPFPLDRIICTSRRTCDPRPTAKGALPQRNLLPSLLTQIFNAQAWGVCASVSVSTYEPLSASEETYSSCSERR
jgi:hypothetical protein